MAAWWDELEWLDNQPEKIFGRGVKPRETHTDWAKVGGWAAASGLCLAVWAAVFVVFYYGWTA